MAAVCFSINLLSSHPAALAVDVDPDFISACAKGTPVQISALIKAGAVVNSTNAGGVTPLMVAAVSNPDVNVIGVLLQAGADVNARNVDQKTPLMSALHM